MTVFDVANTLFPASEADSIEEASYSSSPITGSPVDMGKTAGNCLAVAVTAAITGTPSYAVQIKESATIDGAYTNVPAGGTATLTSANQRVILTFRNTKRFVQAVATLTGTTSLFFGVTILKIG